MRQGFNMRNDGSASAGDWPGGMDLGLRNATPADAGRMLEIYGWYVEHTAITFEYDVPTLGEFTQRIADTTARYPWLALEEEGRILGYAYAGPLYRRAAYDWSCEASIYLDREARGRGLGRQLYGALEEALVERGMRNLYACVAVPSAAEDEYLTYDSVRFHGKLGFTEAGRFHRCGFKFGRWYDVAWMEKLIGEHDAPIHTPFERVERK